jgi:glycosyltransferase involved in cell wall biosynthesis
MSEKKVQESLDQPLVSVGMPIRNGAKTLAMAIGSVVNQTYENLEIIISDNSSDDETPEICKQYAAQDPRIRYFRQEKVITAIQNFRFVFEQSHGKYFMWAAHDDLRTENYIEVLLEGFKKVPSASLVFSDVAIFHNYSSYRNRMPMDYEFESLGLSFIQKFRKSVYGCLHMYGLIKLEYLSDYGWYDVEMGPDVLLLSALVCRGPFVYSKGAIFYYWRTAHGRDMTELAVINFFRKPRPFPYIRYASVWAKAVTEAELKEARKHNRSLLFMLFYFYILGIRDWSVRGFARFIYVRFLPSSIQHLLWKKISVLTRR